MLARTHSLDRYVAATAVIVLTGALWLAGAAVVRTTAFLTVFPLTILVVAARFGMGPAVASALGGVLAFDFRSCRLPCPSPSTREGTP